MKTLLRWLVRWLFRFRAYNQDVLTAPGPVLLIPNHQSLIDWLFLGVCLDDDWKFGSDDLTLSKLIKGEIPQQTMPAAFGGVLKDDEIWKIIAFIRSLYQGDPSKIDW